MTRTWSHRGHWLGPGSVEVAHSCLLLQRSLAQTCSLESLSLIPTPASGLLWWRLLTQACSCGCHCLRPVPTGVVISGLLLQRLLSWACSQAWRHFLNCYYLFSNDSILNQIDVPSHHIYGKARKQHLVLCLGCHWPGFLRQSLFTILEFPD